MPAAPANSATTNDSGPTWKMKSTSSSSRVLVDLYPADGLAGQHEYRGDEHRDRKSDHQGERGAAGQIHPPAQPAPPPAGGSQPGDNLLVATWDDVARIADGLPETTEASPRTWRVRKKLIAWERPLRRADYEALGADAPDGDILGARVPDEGVKFALIADDPRVYFTTPHFDGYPAILVRLAEISVPELEELVTDAWLAQAPKTLVKAFLDAAGR